MQKTKQLLFRLGIRSTYNGFHYLCYALELCKQNEDYLLKVQKLLYSEVAERYGVSRDSVEHCLKTVVNACWDRGDQKFLIKISGCEMTGKPTPREFIDILYYHLAKVDD